METIFIVFKANLKRALNEKGKFLINLFFPIAAIVLAMFANYISNPSINVGVVSKVNFQEEQRIISLLKETKGINVKMADEKLLKTDMILGKYDGVIIFKKNLTEERLEIQKSILIFIP